MVQKYPSPNKRFPYSVSRSQCNGAGGGRRIACVLVRLVRTHVRGENFIIKHVCNIMHGGICLPASQVAALHVQF